MKFRSKWLCVVVVWLFLAMALGTQTPASHNQSTASASTAATAEVPRLIKFSGALLDAQGRPQAGPVGVTFSLYAQQTGGAALWMETQNVKPDENGNYTVLLGANSAKGVPAELFTSNEARWLGIQVGQQPEHERILLVSVPYALKAGDAETLGGLPASAFVTTGGAPANTANAGSGAASSSSTAVPTSSITTAPKKATSTPQTTSCTSVTSDGTATAGSISQFTTPCNVEGSLMKQTPINGFPGVNLAGNNAGLLLNGTGTHQVTMTGTSSSGRLGQDAQGFFFASDTNAKVIKFLTNNGTLNEWMRITSAGNVGIGTTTPGAKLEVAGNVTVSGGGVITGNGSGLTNILGVPASQTVGPINPQQVALLRWYGANQSGAAFAVGALPEGVAFDGANIWVPNGNTVTKLRACDGTVLGTFGVSGTDPLEVAFDGANIWVTNFRSSNVTKLQARDGTVLGTFAVGTNPSAVAFDGANIWVANAGSSNVTKLRASDGTILGTFAVGINPEGVAFDGANMWVTNQGSNNVTKMRASDGAVLGTFAVGSPKGVAFDGANIWVTSFSSSNVTKLRASDGTALGTFAVGTNPFAVAFDGANMWVTNQGSSNVTKLRASDGTVLGTFAVGFNPEGVAFDGANIWVVNHGSSSVTKL